jgi:hypothetical protein
MNVMSLLARALQSCAHPPPQARAAVRWLVLAALSALVLLTLLPERSLAQPARPEPVPVNPLKVGTLVEFDTRAQTVGDAFGSMLEPVRYRVTDRTVDPLVSEEVLRRRVPPIAARAGVMPIEQALLLLIGDDHRLVVDHAHRLVAIERHAPEPVKEP